MAQPNVAREPSMEEILASIRRIIESNEPNAENALSGQIPPVYGDDEIEDGEETSFVPEMAANDRGAPSLGETMNYASGSSGQAAQQDRTLSLADVAARVRAASTRQQETGTVRLSPASTAPAPAPVPSTQTSSSPAPVARQGEPSPLRPQMPRMPEFREPASQAAPVTQAAPASQPAAQRSEPVERVMMPVFDPPLSAPLRAETAVRPEPKIEPKPEPNFAAEPAPRSLPAKIEETANLLSAEAGAQVAKSFSELASVFNGMERRSLEDMAGDMLRPMLQEWLDDNLPTLVERLVREEIERVSRGTRR
ncbi:PopZ family protein [Neorhizobium sp. LjRoot104]|uniref:PopZ family protein n=1 Tax=Neorhizobium sp. LjRoot104 TaxID=3342254 RepID=UPI003ED09719